MVLYLDEGDVLPRQPKVVKQGKHPCQIVESLHLNTMATKYHQRFGLYFKEKKQMTQLIPSLVWKAMFSENK
jgi:hypothetical protein